VRCERGCVAQQDEQRNCDGIDRLDSALARIAQAAGRRQDELRVAELTARAAQHETDLLLQAEQERRTAALSQAADQADADRLEELRNVADRLDGLIAMVRQATGVPTGMPTVMPTGAPARTGE
jgi:septal ring factor EnvC (AmiA/AmiB activator)